MALSPTMGFLNDTNSLAYFAIFLVGLCFSWFKKTKYRKRLFLVSGNPARGGMLRFFLTGGMMDGAASEVLHGNAWQYGTLPGKRFYSLIHCEEALVLLIQNQATETFAEKLRKENQKLIERDGCGALFAQPGRYFGLNDEASTQGPHGTVSAVVVRGKERIIYGLRILRKAFEDLCPRPLESFDIRQIEGKVIEISQLQEIFSEKVLQQATQIDKVHETAVSTTENVREGNENIREAIKNSATFRVWILFFLVMCTFSLLFLDWYNH